METVRFSLQGIASEAEIPLLSVESSGAGGSKRGALCNEGSWGDRAGEGPRGEDRLAGSAWGPAATVPWCK